MNYKEFKELSKEEVKKLNLTPNLSLEQVWREGYLYVIKKLESLRIKKE